MSVTKYEGGHPAYPTQKYAAKEPVDIGNELTVPKAGGKSSASGSYRSANVTAHKSTSAAAEASKYANMSGVGETRSRNQIAAVSHHEAAVYHQAAADHPASGFSKVYHDKMVDHHLAMERHHTTRAHSDAVQ